MRAPTIIHLPATLPPSSPPTPPITSKPTSIYLSRSDSLSPTTNGPQARRKNYLIYFITGNPGLIGYYDLFLSYLNLSLADRLPPSTQVNFDVFGRSLSGFESEARGGFLRRRCAASGYPAEAAGGRGAGLRPGARPPFGLEEQIKGAEWALWDHVQGMREQQQEQGDFDPLADDDEPNIILVGHSVGAYVAMEILRRWREKVNDAGTKEVNEDQPGRIVGAVCLFPTVTHIAKSDSGKKFSALLSIPWIALILHMLATLLTFWIPSALLFHLVQLVARMPEDAARTTTAFIKSRHGIRQALHMARDELRTITHDKWDAELWGAALPSDLQQKQRAPRPQLYFLFGRKDHWVADETRDELIRLRGRSNTMANITNGSMKPTRTRGTTPPLRMTRSSSRLSRASSEGADDDWKPVMEIDDTGIPHGFCIEPRHSAAVAEKVVEYVCEMVRADS
ncbi:hypothetical protein HDK77DRAFT_425932 [Phyllosticta capitalensis]